MIICWQLNNDDLAAIASIVRLLLHGMQTQIQQKKTHTPCLQFLKIDIEKKIKTPINTDPK